MKYVIDKWKCKYCSSEDFTLMDTTLMVGFNEVEEPYYYHYGDYEKGCRQRIPYKEIFKYAKIIKIEKEI